MTGLFGLDLRGTKLDRGKVKWVRGHGISLNMLKRPWPIGKHAKVRGSTFLSRLTWLVACWARGWLVTKPHRVAIIGFPLFRAVRATARSVHGACKTIPTCKAIPSDAHGHHYTVKEMMMAEHSNGLKSWGNVLISFGIAYVKCQGNVVNNYNAMVSFLILRRHIKSTKNSTQNKSHCNFYFL